MVRAFELLSQYFCFMWSVEDLYAMMDQGGTEKVGLVKYLAIFQNREVCGFNVLIKEVHFLFRS